jgi:hypothetical protein
MHKPLRRNCGNVHLIILLPRHPIPVQVCNYLAAINKKSKFVSKNNNMAAATIEKQINDYLVQLTPKQKKAVLTVAKTFAEEQTEESNIWNDKDFIAEIERRTAELETGKIKGLSWNEVKQNARKAATKKSK